MFNWLKKKTNKKEQGPQLLDLSGLPLSIGDKVAALRYDLGECTIVEKDGIPHYQSSKTATQVTYAKMIDAITGLQKVNKL